MSRREGVSYYVRLALLSRPYVLIALQQGIINYSALAKLIHGDVEKIAGRSFTKTSIKMAVLRVAKSMLETIPPTLRLSRVLSSSSLRVYHDLSVLSVPNSVFHTKIEKMFASGSLSKTSVLHVIKGETAVTIITDTEAAERIVSILTKEEILRHLRNQAAIVLTGPPEILTTPGIVSLVSMSIAVRGVNLTEIVSCHRDIILIVEGSDLSMAYDTLRTLIEWAKTQL
ncbi:MAG: hypothetical protein LM573_04460 [Thermofilum sp.]|nr:hypothetical protein [Thermofilum sp.]